MATKMKKSPEDGFAKIAHEEKFSEDYLAGLFREFNARENVIVKTIDNHGEPTDLDTPLEPKTVHEETRHTIEILLS